MADDLAQEPNTRFDSPLSRMSCYTFRGEAPAEVDTELVPPLTRAAADARAR